MEKKNIYLDFNLSFQDIKELNPSFDLAKIAIAYHGKNRNQSEISKDVFENALSSLYNIPVVGRYIPEEDNFGGHDMIVTESNGNQSLEVATVPFGVVPESADVHWEKITEEDGTEREYMITDCVIWKRSYGYKKLVSQKTWSQSMEITVNDYDVSDDGFMVVKDMTFCALCILGNGVEPCFESANIQFNITPENEEFKKNFSAMLSELKELASQDLKKVFEIETEEGGEMKLDKEMLTYDGEETTEETTTGEETTGTEGETTGTGTESEGETTGTESGTTDTEGGTTSTEGGSGSEGASGSGDTSGSSGTSDETPAATVGADDVPTTRKKRPDEFVLEYSKTYNELRDALCTAVRGMCEIETLGDTVVSETDYYLCDFDDEYVYAEYCTYSAEGRKGGYIRARYAKVEDNIEISTPEEMFVKWLTGEEVLALEKSREELTALREFKAERLAGDHKNEVDKYIAENFCDINATEEFIALGEEIYSLDSEQLTEKLFAIRGRHASFNPIKPDSKASDKNEAIKIPVDTNKKSSKNEGRYGSLFETYAKK